MRFPVNFLSYERELLYVGHYLKGRVLNAGCGSRDITGLLKSWNGNVIVDNCDTHSSIPGAFICDLTDIPRPDQSYDAILCNAVLEHVADPKKVMLEFHRLLIEDGVLVISVPMLQPFHPSPIDVYRYTSAGLEALIQVSGFELLEMRPMHSFAQTAGWLIWAHFDERQNWLGKALVWLPIYLLTRMIQRPPSAHVLTAKFLSSRGRQA